MTIKQQGGIFGRNPTFSDLTVSNALDATSATTTLGTNTVIQTADSGVGPSSSANELMVENADNAGITIATPDFKAGAIFFGKPTGAALGRLQYNHDGTGGYMRFFTNNSEAARFNAAGHLDMTNGHDGNIILASGAGIDFSATAGTGTSELFDDYEEGIFVATLTPATSGSITVSAPNNELAYTKVGRQVFINGMIIIDSVSSPVGASVKLNLPFTTANLADAAGRSAGISVQNTSGAYALTPMYCGEGAVEAEILYSASTTGAAQRFYFSFSYVA